MNEFDFSTGARVVLDDAIINGSVQILLTARSPAA